MHPVVTDPAHAAFSAFTDARTMRYLLADPVRALWCAPVRIAACELAHTWRKTYAKATSWHRSTLRVCYRLRLESERGRAFSAWVHGTARLAPATSDIEPGGRVATIRCGAAEVALRRFPDDAALPQLPRLLDPARLAADLVAAGVAPGASIAPDGIEVFRYRPGERCALRVTLSGDRGHAPVRLFGKTFADDRGEHVFRRLRELARLRVLGGSGPIVANPLGYDAATRTLWQPWIDGTDGGRTDAGRELTDDLALVIRSLADLHRTRVRTDSDGGRLVLLAETSKRARKLAAACPATAGMLAETIERCGAALTHLPPARFDPIHGDVHLDQFLLRHGAAVMVDLDELQRGEAAQDLAALLVDIRLRAIGAASDWHRAVITAYGCARGPVSTILLSWYLALQCVQKAYRLYWRGIPALDATVVSVIDWAAQCAQDLPDCGS